MVARCSHFIDVSDATKPAFWQPFLKDSLSLKLAAQNSSKFHTCLIIPMHLPYGLTLNFSSFSGGDRNLSGNIWTGTNNLSLQKDHNCWNNCSKIAVSFCWSAIGIPTAMIWSFPFSLFQLLEIQVRMNHDDSWWTAVIFVGYMSKMSRRKHVSDSVDFVSISRIWNRWTEQVPKAVFRSGFWWLVYETHPPQIAGLKWCRFEKPRWGSKQSAIAKKRRKHIWPL